MFTIHTVSVAMVSVQAMQRLVVGNMLLYFLFLGAVVSAPADSKNENNNLGKDCVT